MTTEERAKQLLDDILQRYYDAEWWERKPLMEMIEDELAKFNTDIAEEVDSILASTLSSAVTKATAPSVVPTTTAISSLLYNNSTQVATETFELLISAQDAQSTAYDLATQLYDGYGFNDSEVLDVIDKLPNYISEFIDDPSLQEDFLKQVAKLETKPLKVATEKIADAVAAASEEALHDALEIYLEEKARFYADRIAKTEIQRAKSLGDAYSIMNDGDIELVRFELSSRHKIYDICDYYANLNMGYGPGIYTKEQYPALPLHPFCMCKVTPYYHNIKKKNIKDPTKELMDSLSPDKQRAIAGSWDKLGEYLNGRDLIDIMNEARPKYPIVTAKSLLK